ncbi:MAG: N-acetylmuramic acid 6-phosphate etherase [Chloroflexi bacterium]|nr:N-acetylmuramic acid 6-phosphate etherase [Chloroflexota bacterium]
MRTEHTQQTEAVNPHTRQIDQVTTLEMVRLMADEDARVAPSVAAEAERIAAAIDAIAARFRSGGRLIYTGAGTSGRLGALDATEIQPTFGIPPGRVVALIAGGERAITGAIEGAEDDAGAGAQDIAGLAVTAQDAVIGIAASGGTPYVIGGMQEARRRGAFVAGIACNRPSPMEEVADLMITPLVGPEAITGSTRLKAGTAQKMVLNMISSGVMIRMGKTFGNLMVDVQSTNAKLRNRARRIVEIACDLSPDAAAALLARCDGEVKTALVCALAQIPPEQARHHLRAANGIVALALKTPVS